MKYRGWMIRTQGVAFIQALIDKQPEASRRRLSAMLCEHWGWVQPNGQLRDMVCRSLMFELHRAGHNELPPVRCRPPNNVTARHRPKAVDSRPWRTTLAALQPLTIRQVRAPKEELLFGALVEARGQNIRCLAYNCRFFVVPWVAVPTLASHLLGRMAKRLAVHWERIYGHPVYYLETVVEPGRFRATCYRAANWISLGLRLGLGKDARSKRANRPRKEILSYPLDPRFRTLLCELR